MFTLFFIFRLKVIIDLKQDALDSLKIALQDVRFIISRDIDMDCVQKISKMLTKIHQIVPVDDFIVTEWYSHLVIVSIDVLFQYLMQCIP
jgi:hypothetical protein